MAAWVGSAPWFWIAQDYQPFFLASRTATSALYRGPWYNFLYPPTAIPPLRLLLAADYWPGFLVLGLVSAACFYLATRRLTNSRIALLSLGSMPAIQGLIWGQVPMLLTACVLAAMCLRDNAKGLVIGALITMKPQLLMLAPLVYVLRSEVRVAVMIGFGSLLSVLCSILLFGIGPWTDWFAAIPDFPRFLTGSIAKFGMISLPGVGLQLGLPTLPFFVAGLVLSAWLVWHARDVSDPVTLTALIGGASIMASPYAMIHDAIILMPAAVSCMLRGRLLASITAIGVYAATIVPLTAPAFLIFGWIKSSVGGEPHPARLAD